MNDITSELLLQRPFPCNDPKQALDHRIIMSDQTLVLITIDAENSLKFENGCWSQCVNGHDPEDLETWFSLGLASRTSNGYRQVKNLGNRLHEARDLQDKCPTAASAIPADQRLDNATSGLPLIFKSCRRFDAPCIVFLDVTGLYQYGHAEFAEACNLIMDTGHDLQTHIHPECLTQDWFDTHDIQCPSKGTETQFWTRDTIYGVHRQVTEDLTRFKGSRPIAYRAGAYRISNTIIDALVELGYKVDSSYDILNKKGHVQLDRDMLDQNAIMEYRGLIEAPISAYQWGRKNQIKRFVGNKHAFDRIEMLKDFRQRGIRVVNYILHSYSLMQVYGTDDDPRAKIGRKGPCHQSIEHFEAELDYMQTSGEFKVVDTQGLLDHIAADPSILRGDGAIPIHHSVPSDIN